MLRIWLKRRLQRFIRVDRSSVLYLKNIIKRIFVGDNFKNELNQLNQTLVSQSTECVKTYYSKFSIVAFALMGFCNLYPVLVILSAAHDLLKPVKSSATTGAHNKYDCNEQSTGIVLIADILPGLVVKLVYSALPGAARLKYSYRVGFIFTTSLLSFLIIWLSFHYHHKTLMLVGIALASISTSIGEMTFLGLTTLYPKRLGFFPYAIGLAMTGLVSSSAYAALTLILRPDQAIVCMIFIPFLLLTSYLILPSPERFHNLDDTKDEDDQDDQLPKLESMNLNHKLRLVVPLLKYMIPLFLVFFAEYVINQGLFELIYFPGSSLLSDHSSQYRWYNVTYRIGVFISRISVLYFPITNLPIFPIFQIINLIILLTHTLSNFIPCIEIVLLIILWEGVIGGACYVNALNMVSNQIAKQYREFSIGLVTIADTTGIALAGFTAIPLHNSICRIGLEQVA